MNKFLLILLCITVWGISELYTASMATPPAGKTWIQTFRDDFTLPPLDSRRWNTTYPNGDRTLTSNGEAQWYMDDAFEFSPEGVLKIRADQRQVNGYNYTSGMAATWGKFSQQYGYFEMRAKLPRGKGLWPAFWLLPTSYKWPPEIDIMEHLGHLDPVVYFSNHWCEACAHKNLTQPFLGPDFTADFHIFGLEWDPAYLAWYVDNVEKFRTTTNIPQIPMYVLLNLAVGGYWPGYPDGTTVFPAYYEIDWVKVWQ